MWFPILVVSYFLLMSSLNGTKSTDPVGTETLDHIGEAEAFNRWMYSAISPFLEGNILEIGSGIGNISAFLLNNKKNVTLSDLRSEYCNQLSKRFMDSKSLAGVRELDLGKEDFDNKYSEILNKFDTVFALNVIEHIENDLLAIRNCKKLLKDNGTILILVPSYPWLFCRFDKELGHFRRYNRKSVYKLLNDNGFKVNIVFYFNAVGVLGWFFFGKLLNNRQIKQGQMKLYNNFVSLFILIDKILFHKFGLSLIITASK